MWPLPNSSSGPGTRPCGEVQDLFRDQRGFGVPG